MFSLEGKVAVVTGAASGIGKAACLRFARAGAKVVAVDIADGTNTADEAGGIFIKADVSKEGDVENAMETAIRTFGRLDVVVNNAGIGGQEGLIQDASGEALDDALNVNLKGVFWGIKHAAPRIVDGGSIINTASYAGLFGSPVYSVYVASKFAVVGITKTAALELAARRVRVNCVCPSTVDTPMTYAEGVGVELKISSLLTPLGRLASPEEIAALFHFLASDEAPFITGVAIPVDGGMSAGPGLNMIGALYQVVAGQEMDVETLLK